MSESTSGTTAAGGISVAYVFVHLLPELARGQRSVEADGNAIIGYLVVHREEDTTRTLVFFALALGLHFVVNDHALRERHRDAYHDLGRWLLVAALGVGWLVGELSEISDAALGLLVAFLAGGVILNVMKEELPEERQSSLTAFAAAAAAYTVILQLA